MVQPKKWSADVTEHSEALGRLLIFYNNRAGKSLRKRASKRWKLPKRNCARLTGSLITLNLLGIRRAQ